MMFSSPVWICTGRNDSIWHFLTRVDVLFKSASITSYCNTRLIISFKMWKGIINNCCIILQNMIRAEQLIETSIMQNMANYNKQTPSRCHNLLIKVTYHYKYSIYNGTCLSLIRIYIYRKDKMQKWPFILTIVTHIAIKQYLSYKNRGSL